MSDRKQQYRRSIQHDLEEQLKFKEIVVVTGMRRVGKTTLLRMIYDSIQDNNKVFLDLENLLDQDIFNEKDFNNIWNNLKQVGLTRERRAYIFLDEIQARLFQQFSNGINCGLKGRGEPHLLLRDTGSQRQRKEVEQQLID